ncbi:Light-harvesting protein B-800/850 alpha chain [Rhodovastum atsumiense]|uniref:Light-harvesting protein n=1 Tax=Rhodovastum atsumiense TaxID=504468 RepID=A0A5M6IMF5_9PROT|nr:light-harvesting antenna LH1, alpha subunit [Rhodovastum atsumiense]KAA5609440.1 light-harvesting protein [Rhodovastum atsumiense]CAH2603519.1 Light-harvesting protein B-800/850 alpha chain [Rhodovastum atsumiense]
MQYDPKNDYKIWLVINPATWLVPIWIALLALVVVIHLAVVSSPKFNFLAASKVTEAVK